MSKQDEQPPAPNLTIEEVKRLYARMRSRPSFLETLLEFQLGRKPTQAEVDYAIADMRLQQKLREEWIAAQPWHTRKRYVSKESRLRKVLSKRYHAPDWLVDQLVEEVAPGPYD